MTNYTKKDVFDELRTGSHISIGHPMWTYIIENQGDLCSYFSELDIELEIVSDVGYCYFKTSNSSDLIELKRARLVVAMLNILILEVKNLNGDEGLDDFLTGRTSIPIDSVDLHNTGRFSKALKQLGVSDNAEAQSKLKSLASFGFHKIVDGRIVLQKASERIFRYTRLEIPKVDALEEEE